MTKTSKLDYERLFNKIFGTHIKWSKLSRDELVELATVLSHPEIILSNLGIDTKAYKTKLIRERFVEAGIELLENLAEEWEGPLISLAKRVFRGKSQEESEKQ